MKIAFYPHQGANRPREGERWSKGLKWGADIMIRNLTMQVPDWEITPHYTLDWDAVKDADVIWLHNIATTAYVKKLIVKDSPIPRWSRKKPRPALIGGVRGKVGLERSRNLLQHFDAVHAGSDELKQLAQPYNSHVYVFYPGVDTQHFKPDGTEPEMFTLGWVGDKNKRMKNYEIIETLGYSFRIASKDNYIPHPEMPGFYNSLTVYTHFSSHEGGNRTIMEAAACGKPIVATDVGTSSMILQPRWLVPYTDDHEKLRREFKKRLTELEADPQLRKEAGEHNREAVMKFDWKQVAQNWVKIIEETLDRAS